MTEDEKYLFDLTGFIHINGVLSAEEVKEANAAIDEHTHLIRERTGELSLSDGFTALKGTTGRGDLGGCIFWEKPWCDPFRKMMVHPVVIKYLNVILGDGFRVDHGPSIITMRKGAEGHTLHGSSGPGFDANQYYIYRNGRMHNGLTVVSWQFADVGSDDGGFALIPGSHKSNFPCPREVKGHERLQEIVTKPVSRAGDVLIFTEAVTHGTLPWRADHDRRSLLIRYSPACMAYANSYDWPELEEPTDAELAVLEGPYHPRVQGRPILEGDGSVKSG